MSARRLLVLCYFYPPLAGGGVHRVLGFTRHLPAHGWNCTVVCAGTEDYWVVDETLLAHVPAGTEVVRVPGGSALSAWLKLRRGDRGRRPGRLYAGLRALSDWLLVPDPYAGWAGRAAAATARLLAPKPGGIRSGAFDAMLSSSPPDSVHLAALRLRRRFALPWVVDFRDPWMGLWLRRPPTTWHRARQVALEREVLLGADVVLAASETHARMLRERRSPQAFDAGRVLHLPNGYEPAATAAPPEPSREPAAEADSRHFTLVFTGTLRLLADTEVFLAALHEVLARRPEARRWLRARLVGPYESDYADRAVALGLTGVVEFTGSLPHAEARALQRDADLLLLWKVRGAPAMVPGKLYEYLDAGRPLVALLDPDDEAGRLVREAGGTLVRPGDRAALADEIERRYAAWREGERPASRRPAWLEEHTRERLAARLAGVLDGLVRRTA
jgi:glycosyltransferase involved in cell wall biosynthesis